MSFATTTKYCNINTLLGKEKVFVHAAMTVPSKPERPQVGEPTETSATVRWNAVDGATGYAVLMKEVFQDWASARRYTVSGDIREFLCEDLSPTSTFQFKLVVLSPDGESEPSEEAVVDTLVANCGPNESSKTICCVVV